MEKKIKFTDNQVEFLNSVMSKQKCSFPEAVRHILNVYSDVVGHRPSPTLKMHLELNEKVDKLVKIMKQFKNTN